MRKFTIYNTDNDDDVILTGEIPFNTDPEDVVPKGYIMDVVQNSPEHVQIYVKVDDI